MEMEFSRLEKVVGTFIVGVILLLMATLVIIGRGKDWFETYITYYTTFKESYNLQEDAAVKLFKADIGKVSKIALEEDHVRVKMAILERYASRIRDDAIAVVESPTFIGSEYISIIPGSADAPLIPAGGEVASREKRSIEDILTEFEVEKTAKLVVKAVQDISGVAQKLSDAQGPFWTSLDNINRISGHIEQITADLDAGKGPMGALLKSEALLQTIMNNLDHMEDILDSFNVAAAKAPHTMTLVQENLVTYRDTGALIKERVDEVQQVLHQIQSATDSLQVVIDNIKTGSYHVPRIATTFKDGIEEIREGVVEINRVVDSLQENMFIQSNLPPVPSAGHTDAGARP